MASGVVNTKIQENKTQFWAWQMGDPLNDTVGLPTYDKIKHGANMQNKTVCFNIQDPCVWLQ